MRREMEMKNCNKIIDAEKLKESFLSFEKEFQTISHDNCKETIFFFNSKQNNINEMRSAINYLKGQNLTLKQRNNKNSLKHHIKNAEKNEINEEKLNKKNHSINEIKNTKIHLIKEKNIAICEAIGMIETIGDDINDIVNKIGFEIFFNFSLQVKFFIVFIPLSIFNIIKEENGENSLEEFEKLLEKLFRFVDNDIEKFQSLNFRFAIVNEIDDEKNIKNIKNKNKNKEEINNNNNNNNDNDNKINFNNYLKIERSKNCLIKKYDKKINKITEKNHKKYEEKIGFAKQFFSLIKKIFDINEVWKEEENKNNNKNEEKDEKMSEEEEKIFKLNEQKINNYIKKKELLNFILEEENLFFINLFDNGKSRENFFEIIKKKKISIVKNLFSFPIDYYNNNYLNNLFLIILNISNEANKSLKKFKSLFNSFDDLNKSNLTLKMIQEENNKKLSLPIEINDLKDQTTIQITSTQNQLNENLFQINLKESKIRKLKKKLENYSSEEEDIYSTNDYGKQAKKGLFEYNDYIVEINLGHKVKFLPPTLSPLSLNLTAENIPEKEITILGKDEGKGRIIYRHVGGYGKATFFLLIISLRENLWEKIQRNFGIV